MSELFFGQGTGHSIMLLAFVIATGLLLGRIKVKGVSLGSTWILFVGILLSHFGFRADASLLHFLKEFGLILFVFSIGLQVGPGFFHSFKKGGLTLNILAVCLVLFGVITTYVIHLVTGESLPTMVGVMSGAVTNTPGLGAAQQTFLDATSGSFVHEMLMLTKVIFKIDVKKEAEKLDSEDTGIDSAVRIAFQVKNPAIFGKTIMEVDKSITNRFVISRVCRPNGNIEMPLSTTVLNEGDKVLVVTSQTSVDVITMLFGEAIPMDNALWNKQDTSLNAKRLLITKSSLTGKKLKDLKIRSTYGVSVTRVTRAGVDLVANPNLILQMGDNILVVGPQSAIDKVARLVGNTQSGLSHPNLIPIFFGIALGVFFGSIPFKFPGIPQAIKLGLAGGPLIIAILISYFGPRMKVYRSSWLQWDWVQAKTSSAPS